MLVGVIGNTTDFDSVILGSSPKPVTKKITMKTAIQELIEKVEHAISYNVEGGLVEKYTWTELFDDMDALLEKEKEQIIDAYEDGYEACDMDEAMEVNKKLTSGDLYYNMNYNQNK